MSDSAELRERVVEAIGATDRLAPTDREVWLEQADAVLAALGLDDLDAAVERATEWLHESPWSQCNMGSDTCDTRPLARGVLLAALTPPGTSSP